MTKIIAIENVTLDGVMQAPASPDEDPRGGFGHGGWGQPYNDEVSMRIAGEGMAAEGAMLLGRVTYERFHHVWAGRDDNPFSAVLDARHKYATARSEHRPSRGSQGPVLDLACGSVTGSPSTQSTTKTERDH